jgi:hypothetical protein
VRDAGDELADLLLAAGRSGHGSGVDVEVEAGGGEPGIRDAVGQGRLDGDVLLVGRGHVEQDGALAVDHAQLGQGRARGAEPEGLTDAAAHDAPAPQADDVLGRRPLVVADEGDGSDDAHVGSSAQVFRQSDDNEGDLFSSN